MKNKLMIIGIAIILMLASSITVFAADNAALETTVTLLTDKSEVKAGETFTVTLKATCPDGINGVVTTYSYDEDKLEYVSENVVDSNYSFGGNKNAKEIFVYCTSTDSIQSADVYAITFRVKEGVEANSIATVSLAETTLDSDAATDSKHTIPAQNVTVTIVETSEDGDGETPPADDGKDDGTTPPADDGKDDGAIPPADDGKDDGAIPPADDGKDDGATPPVDDGKDDGATPPADDKKEEIKDNTVAEKEYDKAGVSTMMLLATLIVSVVAIIMYIKNKKYQDII